MIPENEKRALMTAAIELGRAAGLTQAAKIIQAVADGATRVVGTDQLKKLALDIAATADEIETRAQAKLRDLGGKL